MVADRNFVHWHSIGFASCRICSKLHQGFIRFRTNAGTEPISSFDYGQESRAMRFLKQLLNQQEGATAAEYGILLGLIIVVSVGTLSQFGGSLLEIYNIINAGLP